ncbi:TRAP transporter small permease [Paracoccus jiaweipingae]|uniref:TRAP transporter small permease n=1 Tax=unclassified Paracoccus (in: a-proteobacteria) TaxID=2688777 RepID=UPI0037A371D9
MTDRLAPGGMTPDQTPTASPDGRDDSPGDAANTAYRSALPGALGWLDQGIARLEAFILGAGVLAMAANTMANVVGRYVFNSSLFFSEELNRVLIVLITFAGLSYAARNARHIRMAAFLEMFPRRIRKPVVMAIAVVSGLVMLALAWFSLGYVQTMAARGRVLPAMDIPVWWTLVWVPVGFALTGVIYLLAAARNVISDRIWMSVMVPERSRKDGG